MVLREAKRLLKENGTVVILELDNPPNRFLHFFVGLWFFYWLPFNFETPTRRDMLNNGLGNELKETGFKEIKKTSKSNGIFQTVQGVKDSLKHS